ncbi:hypothetical protein BJ508DRAFT_329025 [Ascobolus immersus RN42]|uniref:Uncharacterized protein n=1 Tax=Ascobolus immersus RN42 TaxID=1160509 RepID=A0A3N4HZZ7_ASCIM|nr:hypothetical protein BJ508DRAFT_329025 [Ascobolus immersus RN42]
MVAAAPYSDLILVAYNCRKDIHQQLTSLGAEAFALRHKVVLASNRGKYLRLGTGPQKHRIHCIIPKEYPNIGFVIGIYHHKHQASDKLMSAYGNESGPMDDYLNRLKAQIGNKLDDRETVAVYPPKEEKRVLQLLGWAEELHDSTHLSRDEQDVDAATTDSESNNEYTGSWSGKPKAPGAKNYHDFEVDYDYDENVESDEMEPFI